MKHSILNLPLSHSYSKLGEDFFSYVQPTPFNTSSELVHYNSKAAALLDLQDNAHQYEAVDDESRRVQMAGVNPKYIYIAKLHGRNRDP